MIDTRKYERKLSNLGAESYAVSHGWQLEHKFFISTRWGKKFQGLFLDFGCGTGIVSGNLKSVGREVIGVDISENMCKITRELHGIQVVIADGLNLPFIDMAFNVVCIAGVFHHLLMNFDLEKAFTEIARCTRNNICMVEPSTTSPPLPIKIIHFCYFAISVILKRLRSKNITGVYQSSIYEKPINPARLIDLCNKNKYKISEIRYFNHIRHITFLPKNFQIKLIHSMISTKRGTHIEIIARARSKEPDRKDLRAGGECARVIRRGE